MGATLDALHRLQHLETELSRLRAKEETLQREIRACERHLRKNDEEQAAHLENVAKAKREIDKVDLNIKCLEGSLGKHRQTLNTAKSNREYAAVLTTINTEKADQAKLENRALQLMSELDQLKATTQTFEQEQVRLQGRRTKLEKQLKDVIDGTRSDRQKLEAEKDQAAASIPPSALDTFQRVAAKHDGEAMAEVVKINRRGEEFMCSGCNMSVPLETINTLASKDELRLCNCCGRILHLSHTGTTV